MKNVRFGVFSASLVAAVAAFAGATVSDVKVTPLESSRHVEITYMLKGDPAIVTVEMATNGIPVGAKASRSVVGDVNLLVQPSDTVAKRISWSADDDLPGCVLAKVSVTVKLWSPDNPPNYLAARIVPNEAKHTMYFTCEDALPGGIEDRRWRTDYLLMRRIPHSSDFWRMGAQAGECDARAASEVPHYVKLTKDYYIGVFEMTQRQFASLWPNNPYPSSDAQKALPDADIRPVTCVYVHGMLRHTPSATSYRWPEDGHSYSDAVFMGKLLARTGIAFDLPTDAQWEYAARAGEKAAMYNGKPAGDDSVTEIAWCQKGGATINTPAPVGSLKPNAWGLYDTLGNVGEWTLDWWTDSSAGYPNNDYHYNAGETGGIVDPVGPDSSGKSYLVVRGCGTAVAVGDTATYVRAAHRLERRRPTDHLDWIGFRVVCPCPAAASF